MVKGPFIKTESPYQSDMGILNLKDMYKLRDYQQKASDAALFFFALLLKKNNAIMVLPTGAGDTARTSHRL